MNTLNRYNPVDRSIDNYRKCRVSYNPIQYIDVNNSLSRGQKHFSYYFMKDLTMRNKLFVLFQIAWTFRLFWNFGALMIIIIQSFSFANIIKKELKSVLTNYLIQWLF
jgi:hypothetical protein